MGEAEALEVTNKIFEQLDIDNSGSIDYNEFLAVTMD